MPALLLELSATRVPLALAVEDDIFIEDVVAVAIVIEGFMEVDDIVIEGFMAEDDMDICAKPLLANRRAGAMIVVNSMVTVVTVIRRASGLQCRLEKILSTSCGSAGSKRLWMRKYRR